MDATPLGNLLKELRHGAGLSQRAAAAAVGVSFPHISKIEAGHEVPSAELLVALAKAYKVDHDGLLLAADRLPEDVEEAVIEKKDLAPQFLRSWRSGKISDEDVRRLLDKSDDGGTSSVDNLGKYAHTVHVSVARGEEPVEAMPERPAVYASTADGAPLSERELAIVKSAVTEALAQIKREQGVCNVWTKARWATDSASGALNAD